MRHIDREKLALYVGGGLRTLERVRVWNHLRSCPECKLMLEAEIAFNKKIESKLRKITEHEIPSVLLDAKVKQSIDLITASHGHQLLPKWAISLATSAVVLLSSYGLFFFAPLFGSSRETAAQAVVSGIYYPVFEKATNLVPTTLKNPGSDFEKQVFLNILCELYTICKADRDVLIHEKGYNYVDVFISQIMEKSLGVDDNTVLPLLAKGKTPGQIMSFLGISFPSQLSSTAELTKQIERFKQEIETRDYVDVPMLVKDGKVVSGVTLNLKPEDLKDHQGAVVVTLKKDGTVLRINNEDTGYFSGTISRILDYNNFELKSVTGKTITIRHSFETVLRRYEDPIAPTQLTEGQLVNITGTINPKSVIASIIDVTDPVVTIIQRGIVADLDKDNIALGGFGAALYMTSKTKIEGKIAIGGDVELTATGNDVRGYKVDRVKVLPKITTPTVVEELVSFKGIVFYHNLDESGIGKIYISDGEEIREVNYGLRRVKIEGEKLPLGEKAVGLKVDCLGVAESQKFQMARTIKVSKPTKIETFSLASELTDLRCLTACNWVKSEGLTKIKIMGIDESFLIYPETIGHSLMTPARIGQMVILEGRIIDGIRLIDVAQVTDPTKQTVREGKVVELASGILSLDDGTRIILKPYTHQPLNLVIGQVIRLICTDTVDGLVALTIEIAGTEPETTSWLKIKSFDGSILVLDDGTTIKVNAETKIRYGLTSEPGTPLMLVPGVLVACTYRPGATNIAIEIRIR